MKPKTPKPKRRIIPKVIPLMLFRRNEITLAYDTNSGASIHAKPGTNAEVSIRMMLDEELLKLDIPEAVKKRIRQSTPKRA